MSAVLVGIILAASVYIAPGGGWAPVDVLFIAAAWHCILTVATRAARPDHATDLSWLARPALAALAFVVIAAVSTLIHQGDERVLAVDTFSLLYLFVPVYLLASGGASRGARAIVLACSFSALAFSASVLLEGGLRAKGFMANPNMAAAWLGCAALFLGACPRGMPYARLRWTTALVCIGGIIATNSYSGWLGLAAAACYLLVTSRRRTIAAAVALGAAVLAFLYRDELLGGIALSDRFVSSRGSRTVIWQVTWQTWTENFWGVGHGNFVAESHYPGGIQTHNDLLNALVENGVVGLVALILLGCTLWQAGRRLTRAVLAFVFCQAMFHNVLNFRHVWLFLALTLVFDLWADRTASQSGQLTRARDGQPGLAVTAP